MQADISPFVSMKLSVSSGSAPRSELHSTANSTCLVQKHSGLIIPGDGEDNNSINIGATLSKWDLNFTEEQYKYHSSHSVVSSIISRRYNLLERFLILHSTCHKPISQPYTQPRMHFTSLLTTSALTLLASKAAADQGTAFFFYDEQCSLPAGSSAVNFDALSITG